MDQGLLRCPLVGHIPNVMAKYLHFSPDCGARQGCVPYGSAMIVTAPRELR